MVLAVANTRHLEAGRDIAFFVKWHHEDIHKADPSASNAYSVGSRPSIGPFLIQYQQNRE